MTSVTDWNSRTTYYTYESGNLKTIVRPNGSHEVYNYDAKGQLLTVTDLYANGNTINQYYFAYDADGNIVNENSFNEPDANEISIDNASMGYGNANQLTNFNGTAIAYDANGNMLSAPLYDKWGMLTYDSLNQLVGISVGTDETYSYGYDAEGYRTTKNKNGVVTNFTVNPNAELSQVLMSTKNGETTYYVYGLGLISQENSEGYKLYHYDYRGSTTAITNLNGEVTDTVFYDPYGNIVSRTGSTDTPFLYVGKYGVETDDSGLYYMRARYYNPQIQRFINVDPIRAGYNWYSYVEGNGINNVDPFGLLTVSELRTVSNMYNTGAITTEEVAMYILMNNINATMMSKREIGNFTPFHEIAQVVAAKEIEKQGYKTTLEYKIAVSNKEIDILGINNNNRKIWEVKPISESNRNRAKEQLNGYVGLTNYSKGSEIKFSSDGYKLFKVKGANGEYDVNMYLESNIADPGIIYYSLKSNKKGNRKELCLKSVRDIVGNYDVYIANSYYQLDLEPIGEKILQPRFNADYQYMTEDTKEMILNIGYAGAAAGIAYVGYHVIGGIIGGALGGPAGAIFGAIAF